MGGVTGFLRNLVVVFALFAVPSLLLMVAQGMDDPRMLARLPMVPFVPLMLALWVFVSYSMNGVLAFFLSFLPVAGFCSLLGMAHPRRPTLAKSVAIVVGTLNALLIPTLVPYLA